VEVFHPRTSGRLLVRDITSVQPLEADEMT
jgi:hypothetical protein